jgi:uncharacterized protein (TIGR02996 family)
MAKKRAAAKKQPPEPRAWTAQDTGFVRAILETPEDDAPRLVYADWLDEQGDEARAEFIRGQIALSRMKTGSAEHKKLSKRIDKLLQEHKQEWLRLLTRGADRYVGFSRGFPDTAGASFGEFCYWEESLWDVAPIATVLLYSPWPFDANWGGMFDSEEEMRDSHHRSVKKLAASPNLKHITSLGMYECLDGRDVRVLARSPHLTRMRALHLGGNAIRNTGASAIARSTSLAGLLHLDLSMNQITSDGARALARSTRLTNLLTLDLMHNNINEVVRAELRERFGDQVKL